jgi:hypothetical protein
MGVFLWLSAVLLAVIWAFTAVDVFRRYRSGWARFGWLVLVLLLPFVGSLIYWLRRGPSTDEVELARLAEADVRHGAAVRLPDSTRTEL